MTSNQRSGFVTLLAMLVLLIATPAVAQSVSGGSGCPSNASGCPVTATGGATNTLSNWTAGWNVIVPMNAAADVTTLQNAVNGAQPVLMAAGTWQICSQVTVPANQQVVGVGGSSDPGSSVASTSFGRTIVTCPTNGSFTAGQAYIAVQDHDILRRIDFFCHDGAAPVFNGINALNAVAPEIDHVSVYFCKNGISRYSDGSVPGASVAYSQLAHIHDSMFYKNTDYGYYATGVNGGFVSDEKIGPNNDFAVNGIAGLYMHAGTTEAVFNNRIEDAALGIDLVNGLIVSITGNVCDKIQCLRITNSTGVSVTGNNGDWDAGFANSFLVEFVGTNNNIQFAGNAWYNTTAIYKVDAGGLLQNSSFDEAPSIGSAIYVDGYSQLVIQPLMSASFGSVASVQTAVSAVNVDANVANLITGGDGMTSTWGANATQSTFATAAGANPYGAATAATLTEDSSTNIHYTDQNNGEAAGIYTYSLYIHPGTVGTDNMALSATGSGFVDIIYAYFSPATGSVVFTQTGGAGSIISTGSQLVNNGWYRVWVTFSLGATAQVQQVIYLAQGQSNFFAGNGTNNVLVWGPALRAGTVP